MNHVSHSLVRPAPLFAGVPRVLLALLAIIALAAVVIPALVVSHAPDIRPAPIARAGVPQRVVPKAELPPVEPILFQDLAPQDAVAFNASVPFSTAPNPAAKPFVLKGTPEDHARALDCLAAAVIYEAGDDASGERAVAQVVLNRLRHPAFPKNVCSVVFQGSERTTGCQFTFTCDGAIMRTISPAAWERARDVARMALGGSVDKRVGQATHYHTNWVVPYWSSSLDKITEIHTHLFFRWSGWWGTPPAFNRRYIGAEPMIAKLAGLSEAHRTPDQAAALAAGLDPAMIGIGEVALPTSADEDSPTFLVTLDPKLGADAFSTLANKACGERPYCKFMAWSSKAATPSALPMQPAQQRAMSFSYLRDRAYGFEKALWNCTEFKRSDPAQCMKSQTSISMAPAQPSELKFDATPGSALRAIAGAEAESDAAKSVSPDPLTGVRRRTRPATSVPMNADSEEKPAPASPAKAGSKPAPTAKPPGSRPAPATIPTSRAPAAKE